MDIFFFCFNKRALYFPLFHKSGGKGESFEPTRPIVLRYQVTRSSLISDQRLAEKRAAGVVELQLLASKTNDPLGRAAISPDPGLENAANYNRIRIVGAGSPSS